jgi:hypothetical protein
MLLLFFEIKQDAYSSGASASPEDPAYNILIIIE